MATLDRDTTRGELTQKPGTAGCVSQTSNGGACQDGVALGNAGEMAVSADGKSVYVASNVSYAVAIFDRNATSGELTQKPDPPGCVSETGGDGGVCQDGVGLTFIADVTVSPDSRSVYGASEYDEAVSVFDRNPTTGELTQKPGPAGCISDTGDTGNGGVCQDGLALLSPLGVTVSPDGNSVFAASFTSDALVILDRNAAGELRRGPVARDASRTSQQAMPAAGAEERSTAPPASQSVPTPAPSTSPRPRPTPWRSSIAPARPRSPGRRRTPSRPARSSPGRRRRSRRARSGRRPGSASTPRSRARASNASSIAGSFRPGC